MKKFITSGSPSRWIASGKLWGISIGMSSQNSLALPQVRQIARGSFIPTRTGTTFQSNSPVTEIVETDPDVCPTEIRDVCATKDPGRMPKRARLGKLDLRSAVT
jgi:hypothetical protein